MGRRGGPNSPRIMWIIDTCFITPVAAKIITASWPQTSLAHRTRVKVLHQPLPHPKVTAESGGATGSTGLPPLRNGNIGFLPQVPRPSRCAAPLHHVRFTLTVHPAPLNPRGPSPTSVVTSTPTQLSDCRTAAAPPLSSGFRKTPPPAARPRPPLVRRDFLWSPEGVGRSFSKRCLGGGGGRGGGGGALKGERRGRRGASSRRGLSLWLLTA